MKKNTGNWRYLGVLCASVLVAGCGTASEQAPLSVEETGEIWELDQSLTAPAYSSLTPLFGTMQGSAIVVSNNPESVNREGLLMATEQLTLPPTVTTVRRTLSGTVQDVGCPVGGLKEFSFYMHHLNNLGANARYYVFVEPATAGTTVTFNAFGAAVSQVDTASLDPGRSPSYSVSQALLTNTLPTWVTTGAGSRMINLSGQSITSRFALVNLGANTNSSVDARVKVRSTNGQCLKVRVAAATATNATEQRAYDLSKAAFAWGNTATGAPCTDSQSIGWGRPAGVYRADQWVGSTNTNITAANSVQGWRLLAAPANKELNGVCQPGTTDPAPSGNNQRTAAYAYYSTNTSGEGEGRDSDPYSTANYGVEYKLNYNVTNTSGQCVVARLQLTSYPGANRCQDVPLAASKSRHYDGAVKITQDGVAQPLVRAFTKCPDGTQISTLATKQLTAGQSAAWNLQFFVPGLISIPEGMLLTSCPCGQTC